MTDHRSDRVLRYEILGHTFTEGVRAALRAYPEMLSVQVDGDDRLVLTLASQHETTDITPFVQVIQRAGGVVHSARVVTHRPPESPRSP